VRQARPQSHAGARRGPARGSSGEVGRRRCVTLFEAAGLIHEWSAARRARTPLGLAGPWGKCCKVGSVDCNDQKARGARRADRGPAGYREEDSLRYGQNPNQFDRFGRIPAGWFRRKADIEPRVGRIG
jgi:hypothetical protein